MTTAIIKMHQALAKLSTLELKTPLKLDCGVAFGPVTVAYQQYGSINSSRDNVILVCHALTGDQYATDVNPITGKPGWWHSIIGADKVIDTNKYCVICSNVLGGCMGTTGPASINPASGKPYALDFPLITVGDIVRCQAELIKALGIDRLAAVIGGSMGGMQALQWASQYSHKVNAAIIIASSHRHSAQNIAFHEVGRQAVIADPDWCGGHYIEMAKTPHKGLAVARMAAHITYMSAQSLHNKFGRNLQDRSAPTFSFDADFQVESYLRHQGMTFVDRFDANSYLYLTRAMDYFDLANDYNGILANAFRDTNTAFCLISFSSDWLFPTSETRNIVHALNAASAKVSFVEIVSDKGHDSFLLNNQQMHTTIKSFLQAEIK